MSAAKRIVAAASLAAVLGVAFATATADDTPQRNFAGSVQLDYLAVSHRAQTIDQGLEGATLELSMKLAMDLGDHVQANVKVCFACHGFELGMAFFDIRAADELNVRVGRFTPSFGSCPLRHDPANHQTSDKPLPYDMGRMVRFRDWNEGVLPAPWVDNGVEVNGTHFIGKSAQIDYAFYAISGLRHPALRVRGGDAPRVVAAAEGERRALRLFRLRRRAGRAPGHCRPVLDGRSAKREMAG